MGETTRRRPWPARNRSNRSTPKPAAGAGVAGSTGESVSRTRAGGLIQRARAVLTRRAIDRALHSPAVAALVPLLVGVVLAAVIVGAAIGYAHGRATAGGGE